MIQPETLTIVLGDMPPSLNNAYREVIIERVARRVLTGPAKKWKADAIKQIQVAANRIGWSMAKKTMMQVEVHYQAPNILVWDLDGKLKLLQDAFCEAMGLDDRYVMDIHLSKERATTERVTMHITEWSPPCQSTI